MAVMRVVLISCYEMGRQPFGLGSAAAWLRRDGAAVTCRDLSVESLDEDELRLAGLIAVHVPMHTATRLALRLLDRIRALNRRAHVCFFGLYASINEGLLRRRGVDSVIGGEFESGLAGLARRLGGRSPVEASRAHVETVVSMARQDFVVPDRSDLPPLERYARLETGGGESHLVGTTETTRGCKHLCRHCPVVTVYQGRFRVIQSSVVLEDIRRQVAAGARHITFGDPDFFNGIGHARRIVEALHAELPEVTFDITVKVEHILRHAEMLPWFRQRGCILVTSAIESFDDSILERLDKGHTSDDAVRAIDLCRRAGLALSPTFIPFTPWTSREGYADLLSTIDDLDLAAQVAPVQLSVRLLIPAGSRLLELGEVRGIAGPFDDQALAHPWAHPDPDVDRLQAEVERVVIESVRSGATRRESFDRVLALTGRPPAGRPRQDRSSIPWLTEPWFC